MHKRRRHEDLVGTGRLRIAVVEMPWEAWDGHTDQRC